jgi:hypothetical protein
MNPWERARKVSSIINSENQQNVKMNNAKVKKNQHETKFGKKKAIETWVTKYLSIITLNANGLNSLIKRQWLYDWIKKQDTKICCLQETHLITKDTPKLKVKGWKRYTSYAEIERKQELQFSY